MIQISDKPTKKVEYFDGFITMALPNSENTEWKFAVLRTTNGKVSDTVKADKEQFLDIYQDMEEMEASMTFLEKTVEANLKKGTVEWKVQTKG